MAERASPSKAARFLTEAALVVLLALPSVLGRWSTYVLLALIAGLLLRPATLTLFRQRERNPADLMVGLAVLFLTIATMFSADQSSDLLFIFNFLPFLLMIPLRWHLSLAAGGDKPRRVGWLALYGAAASLGYALFSTLVLKVDRVGQPIMNPFQFADTAILLGFFALVGCFGPGPRAKWPFLFGPIIGIASVLLSGTRGALLAVPLLGVIAFGVALFGSRNRAQIAWAGLFALALAAVATGLAIGLGYGRGMTAFTQLSAFLSGGGVDSSTHERLTLYAGGLAAFWHSPIFGFGWGDMVRAIYPYVPPDMLETVKGFRQLHNGFLCFAVGSGTLGIAAFILLSLAPLAGLKAMRADPLRRARLYGALILVASYQVFQLTFILLGYEFHTLQYTVVTAVLLGYMREEASPPGGRGKPRIRDP